jgi:hypothetical protein
MGIGDAEMTAMTPCRIGLRLVLELAARAPELVRQLQRNGAAQDFR